jgi:hypothetical protein
LGFPISYPPVHTNDNREWWNGLYGMTTKPITELVKLARSWAQAPEMVVKGKGFQNRGYDRGDRAYHLISEGTDALECEIRASEDSPIVNVALVVEKWGPRGVNLQIDGKQVPRGKQFRYGYNYQMDGTTLLAWISLEASAPVTIKLTQENEK